MMDLSLSDLFPAKHGKAPHLFVPEIIPQTNFFSPDHPNRGLMIFRH